MRYVRPLTDQEQARLQHLWKTDAASRVRRRAHATLLSAKGYKVDTLADIFEVDRDTITDWLNRFEEHGPEGLADAPRSGRPPSIQEEDESDVLKMVGENPRQLKTALVQLKERLPEVSLDTIKRFLKRRGWRWRRLRRSLKTKRDEAAFRAAQAELEALKAQEDAGLLDLVYFDAAGFSLEPACAFAWQPPGEAGTGGVPSAKSPRRNVLGFMQRSLRFVPFVVEGSICTRTVIACIDAFAARLRRKTVLVLDNAPVHTSRAFEAAKARWRKIGLRIKHLPSYSPELNLIERLWQEIKYRWLPSGAYESAQAFAEALDEVLMGIGSKYRITFA